MHKHFALALTAALIVSPLAISPAFSVGDGGGGQTQDCGRGKVKDRSGKCVDQQSKLDDETIYEGGRDLAMAGRYDEAITLLGRAANKADPRILNYLGYAHRKSGRITVGLGYYQEALRIDPDYVRAREYLGEAYLTLNDVASARNQLNEIEKRCGRDCREYSLLADQIAQHG
jgi:tetratricopeptide (TPR) repeat protein